MSEKCFKLLFSGTYCDSVISRFFQDYEYASYNPIAYDIANHFCEMVADYHSETPHVLDYSKYPGNSFGILIYLLIFLVNTIARTKRIQNIVLTYFLGS